MEYVCEDVIYKDIPFTSFFTVNGDEYAENYKIFIDEYRVEEILTQKDTDKIIDIAIAQHKEKYK